MNRLALIYTESRSFSDIMNLLRNNNSFFGAVPKSRTAKIVRNVLDIVGGVPESVDIQIDLCRDVIEWCKAEKRTFLRQRVEAKVRCASNSAMYFYLLLTGLIVFSSLSCCWGKKKQLRPWPLWIVLSSEWCHGFKVFWSGNRRQFRELKKLDDKQMLTETHLVESRIYHSLENIPKGKAVSRCVVV